MKKSRKFPIITICCSYYSNFLYKMTFLTIHRTLHRVYLNKSVYQKDCNDYNTVIYVGGLTYEN